MLSEAQIHDFAGKRQWGHNYEITEIIDGGKQVKLAGWKSGISEGHYLILENGDAQTRYRVDEIRYCDNPRDMWFATCSFAPRKALED